MLTFETGGMFRIYVPLIFVCILGASKQLINRGIKTRAYLAPVLITFVSDGMRPPLRKSRKADYRAHIPCANIQFAACVFHSRLHYFARLFCILANAHPTRKLATAQMPGPKSSFQEHAGTVGPRKPDWL